MGATGALTSAFGSRMQPAGSAPRLTSSVMRELSELLFSEGLLPFLVAFVCLVCKAFKAHKSHVWCAQVFGADLFVLVAALGTMQLLTLCGRKLASSLA